MTKRNISASNESATLGAVFRAVLFVRLNFAGGVRRMHTEIGPRTITHPIHGSELYLGLGDFGGLSSEVVESISGAPKSVKISLSGVTSALVTDAFTDDYFRRDADILIGLYDNAGALIDDPEYLFSGFMDKVDISLDDGLAQMTMYCESRGTNLLRSPDQRFTDEDKQAEVSGDLAAEYVFAMQDLDLVWGGSKVGPPASQGGADNLVPPGGLLP